MLSSAMNHRELTGVIVLACGALGRANIRMQMVRMDDKSRARGPAFVSAFRDSRVISDQAAALSTNPEPSGSCRGLPRPCWRPPPSLPPLSLLHQTWRSHRPMPPSSCNKPRGKDPDHFHRAAVL